MRDGVLRARVVPDDEPAERLARLAAPRDRALALVRDACPGGRHTRQTAAREGRGAWGQGSVCARLRLGMMGRTDDLDALLRVARGLEGLARLGDAGVAARHELVRVLLVPSARGRASQCVPRTGGRCGTHPGSG